MSNLTPDEINARHEKSVYMNPQSTAAILLREHDNADQAIAYAERMAQRCATLGGSILAMEYQEAAKELKAWKHSDACRDLRIES